MFLLSVVLNRRYILWFLQERTVRLREPGLGSGWTLIVLSALCRSIDTFISFLLPSPIVRGLCGSSGWSLFFVLYSRLRRFHSFSTRKLGWISSHRRKPLQQLFFDMRARQLLKDVLWWFNVRTLVSPYCLRSSALWSTTVRICSTLGLPLPDPPLAISFLCWPVALFKLFYRLRLSP